MRHFCHLASFNPTHYLYFTFSYFSENMILEHCSGIMRQTLMAKTFATMWNLHIKQVREKLQKSIMHFSSFVIFVNISFADTGKTRVDQKEARTCKNTECPVDNFRNPYSYLAVQGLPETCKQNNVSTNFINFFGQ